MPFSPLCVTLNEPCEVCRLPCLWRSPEETPVPGERRKQAFRDVRDRLFAIFWGGDALITSGPGKNCCGKWDLMIACSRHLLPSAFRNISCSFLRTTASVKHGRVPAQVFGVFFGVPELVDNGARICQGSASRSKKHVRVAWRRRREYVSLTGQEGDIRSRAERRIVLLVSRCVAAH